MNRPILKCIVLSAVAWLALTAAHAQDRAAMAPDAKQAAMDRIDRDPAVSAIYALCPADAFEQHAPMLSRLDNPKSTPPEICAADPASCVRACLEHGDSGRCFGLARAFQIEGDDVSPYVEKLFSMGCAAGMGSACTNRASVIRNRNEAGDPFHDVPTAAQETCEFRSFRIGCRQGDAWSCSMLGQSYELGEGVARDRRNAIRYLRKSCDISPRFVACTFARSHLDAILGAPP